MEKIWKTLAAALVLGAVACGGDDNGPSTASCNIPIASFCMDINGVLASDQSDCTSSGGTWSAAACPTANVVASCTLTNPSASQTITVRFYAPQTPATAQAVCTSLCTDIAGGDAVCNSTCTHLQTDPQNCGACGTACAAGHACTAGVCQ